MIETTGMADPAPVAQTFFVVRVGPTFEIGATQCGGMSFFPVPITLQDDMVKSFARLDGIVTLVDAKHIEQHLDEVKPEVPCINCTGGMF
eukprot:SAG31_NODE_611_length_13558_cov_224.959730_14_plen_90_part_00